MTDIQRNFPQELTISQNDYDNYVRKLKAIPISPEISGYWVGNLFLQLHPSPVQYISYPKLTNLPKL